MGTSVISTVSLNLLFAIGVCLPLTLNGKRVEKGNFALFLLYLLLVLVWFLEFIYVTGTCFSTYYTSSTMLVKEDTKERKVVSTFKDFLFNIRL